MFNRIRIQLTIRNAAVLSVILVGLNVSVFIVMKQMLFAQVDRSLMSMEQSQLVPDEQGQVATGGQMRSSLALPTQRAVLFQMDVMDRPIIQLYWTEDDQLIPLPGREQFNETQLKQLLPSKLGESLQSIKVGNQHYRVLKIGNPNHLTIYSSNGSQYKVASQQLLSNISAEIGMLQRLEYILLFGGIAGLVIAVAAGYYLANRALIPIRLSLDKQQQFVSDASHELRTPLSVIQAHTELLLRHPEHTIEQDSKHISTVLQEARRMSKLVSGLLTLARSDSNQLELEIKSVQLDQIVQESVRKMQMLAELKDIIVQTEIDSSIPMNADEERLHQLLVTLLDNAIKYTPEGGLVRVVCRKLAHSVLLEVEDTGIGIAPDNLQHIFDRFYRGDKARTRQEGGSGLGLAIAKWIVEQHQGKIRVESKLSIGTRIFITLPI
ncbi:sensor histidine kinase [Paenibacillus nasutitermitis]|uniref:histidine kinase n=1 Tax=Paenibacillus nasutitermitis TaxID=1652958 RepID=A0A916YRW3_9BACL|nr:ATP-binding protein [Paenibacillus nasutitermitis]GGD58693.1 two-component sensor histidine kinase [Paenibacillus nasutitermitis]